MMRRTGDTWLISDIYLDGAISEVATRRSEFAATLKNEGICLMCAAGHSDQIIQQPKLP
jgi:ABC-type transporter MlaC component